MQYQTKEKGTSFYKYILYSSIELDAQNFLKFLWHLNIQYFIFIYIWENWGTIGEGNAPHSITLPWTIPGGAWWAAVHGVAKSQTWLSNFPFTFHFHALEKEMATHSSVLAWRIPGVGEPGGLLSMGSHRVRHNWSDLAAAAATQ